MNLTPEQKRIAKQMARQLKRLAQIADENEFEMSNGGILGSILGTIANELELESQKRSV
jgi:hypothetical protein